MKSILENVGWKSRVKGRRTMKKRLPHLDRKKYVKSSILECNSEYKDIHFPFFPYQCSITNQMFCTYIFSLSRAYNHTDLTDLDCYTHIHTHKHIHTFTCRAMQS
uniref:(northern house mosquito) hypothetical protein n=1 Tax=Culex pipiens TaxID=7175 RepID=A0A8D8ALD7_CULPI